jgi:hypothetical protein
LIIPTTISSLTCQRPPIREQFAFCLARPCAIRKVRRLRLVPCQPWQLGQLDPALVALRTHTSRTIVLFYFWGLRQDLGRGRNQQEWVAIEVCTCLPSPVFSFHPSSSTINPPQPAAQSTNAFFHVPVLSSAPHIQHIRVHTFLCPFSGLAADPSRTGAPIWLLSCWSMTAMCGHVRPCRRPRRVTTPASAIPVSLSAAQMGTCSCGYGVPDSTCWFQVCCAAAACLCTLHSGWAALSDARCGLSSCCCTKAGSASDGMDLVCSSGPDGRFADLCFRGVTAPPAQHVQCSGLVWSVSSDAKRSRGAPVQLWPRASSFRPCLLTYLGT